MLKPVLFSLFFLSLLIFPHAGPDTKYFLGFLRTQMGTSVTIVLVFGAKVKLFFLLFLFSLFTCENLNNIIMSTFLTEARWYNG